MLHFHTYMLKIKLKKKENGIRANGHCDCGCAGARRHVCICISRIFDIEIRNTQLFWPCVTQYRNVWLLPTFFGLATALHICEMQLQLQLLGIHSLCIYWCMYKHAILWELWHALKKASKCQVIYNLTSCE